MASLITSGTSTAGADKIVGTHYHSIHFWYEQDENQKDAFSWSTNNVAPGKNSKHTWDDWHLIPASYPVVPPPQPILKYVDIPGSNNSIDLSTYLRGQLMYGDRSGSFEFYVANGYGSWADRKAEINKYLNGRVLNMELEDDESGHYYKGRFYLKDWSAGSSHSTVRIEYRISPYKYKKDFDNPNSEETAVIG